MTVKEYLQQSKWGRLKYRLYRNPLILFVLVPLFYFSSYTASPSPISKSWKRERASVWWTNLAIVAVVTTLSLTSAFKTFLLVQLPITILAATLGTWMFFVQHQFEDTYWAKEDEWDYTLAALQGSSTTNSPRYCNGLPAISAFIIFTISAPGFPTISGKMSRGKPRLPTGRCFDLMVKLQDDLFKPVG